LLSTVGKRETKQNWIQSKTFKHKILVPGTQVYVYKIKIKNIVNEVIEDWMNSKYQIWKLPHNSNFYWYEWSRIHKYQSFMRAGCLLKFPENLTFIWPFWHQKPAEKPRGKKKPIKYGKTNLAWHRFSLYLYFLITLCYKKKKFCPLSDSHRFG